MTATDPRQAFEQVYRLVGRLINPQIVAKMLSHEEALNIALGKVEQGATVWESKSIELSNGWFFPWRSTDSELLIGSQGIIVSKLNGECFQLGSAFPVERDLRLYEAGYTRTDYDIKIRSINDPELTIDMLEELGITVVEPELAHGTLWKIPRRLNRDELKSLLSDLPHTFENVAVYFVIEALERARANRCCEFELIEP